jgi:hypothetical protein
LSELTFSSTSLSPHPKAATKLTEPLTKPF